MRRANDQDAVGGGDGHGFDVPEGEELGEPPVATLLDKVSVATIREKFDGRTKGYFEEGDLQGKSGHVTEDIVEAIRFDVFEDIGADEDVGRLGTGGVFGDEGVVVLDRIGDGFLEGGLAASIVEDGTGGEFGS